jgi:uncharacterized protein (TIGR02569 family)
VTVRPASEVLQAFGAAGTPEPLPGGRGKAWRVGDLVLRPVDEEEPPLGWQAEVLGSVRSADFRLSVPRRTAAGDFESEGWCAWQFVAGLHEDGRWREIIEVGERFHEAIAHVREPGFIARRADPWAIGDRVAWEDLSAEEFAHLEHVSDLVGARRALELPRQLVHGDLTGNVLFADGLAPAIIDLAPYWRPPGYASAIVVGDALLWEGADESLLDAVEHVPHFPQLLVRALIMRAVVDLLFRAREARPPDPVDPFPAAVEIACRIATRPAR